MTADRGGFCRQRDFCRIGNAAQRREQRARIVQGEFWAALAQILGNAGGETVEIDDAHGGIGLRRGNLLRGFQPDAWRMQNVGQTADPLDPGFDAKAQRRDQIRPASRGTTSTASDQYGTKPVSHDTPAGRVLLV